MFTSSYVLLRNSPLFLHILIGIFIFLFLTSPLITLHIHVQVIQNLKPLLWNVLLWMTMDASVAVIDHVVTCKNEQCMMTIPAIGISMPAWLQKLCWQPLKSLY